MTSAAPLPDRGAAALLPAAQAPAAQAASDQAASDEDRVRFVEAVEKGCLPAGVSMPLASAMLMAHAAFAEPERQIDIFDALAHAWLDLAPADRPAHLAAALPFVRGGAGHGRALPPALWDSFWAIAGSPPTGMVDPLAFTTAVVLIGNHYDAALIERCERALLQFEGVHTLLATPEVRMKTADLAGWPDDSLGSDLKRMLDSHGYDLEVIDADAVVLPGPWPAQNRTNRRILQLHDVWHLVAGYGFTGAGEVAISGFQLGQFGQNYSTRFLATVATLMALHMPVMAEPMITLMLEGWRHGRRTPDLMLVPWHDNLGLPIATLRAQIGIRPFDSQIARMMEAAEAAKA